MRARAKIVAPLLLGAVLIAGLVGGCEEQGQQQTNQDGQQEQQGGQEEEQGGLENQLVKEWVNSGHSKAIAFAAEEEGCKNCHDGQTFSETGGGFVPRREAAAAASTATAGEADEDEATGGAEAEGTETTGGAQAEEPEEPRDWVVATDCRVCHTGAGVEIAEEGSVDGIPNLEQADGGLGSLCMACHNGWHPAGPGREGNAAAPHYSVQADMLFGVNALRVSQTATGAGGATTTTDTGAAETSPGAGSEETSPGGTTEATGGAGGAQNAEGEESPHVRVENTCVGCHMAGEGTNHDFSASNYDSCEVENCHDQDMRDGGDAQEDYDGDGQTEKFTAEVDGLKQNLERAINQAAGSTAFKPEGGDVVFEGGQKVDTADPAYQAAYNYLYIDKDSSRGIHNPQFTVTLLQESIEAVGR